MGKYEDDEVIFEKDNEKIKNASLELLIEMLEWIKFCQCQFTIQGEAYYNGAYYKIVIEDPLHTPEGRLEYTNNYKYEDVKSDEPTFETELRKALLLFNEKKHFFYGFFRHKELKKDKQNDN